jgi:hypothetical protein
MEKIGESIPWGPDQEVALLRFEEWKGEYVRMEDGEALIDEIDRQDGWTSKRASGATFLAELFDLKSDSIVGYVPSKLAMQIADDAWATSRHIMPIVTKVTVLADDAQEGCDGAANVDVVDRNLVELQDRTDLVIAPIAGTEMANFFGILVDDKDNEKEKERDEATAAAGSKDVDP